jgi:hypothetical protein
MANKITLITPPDIYENSNKSILFVNIDDKDQELASKWLANKELSCNINFYVFSGESNISWLLHASGVSEYSFINLDNLNTIGTAISSYLLGKSKFFYLTENEDLAAVYSHINLNRVSNIEKFLEKVFSDQDS